MEVPNTMENKNKINLGKMKKYGYYKKISEELAIHQWQTEATVNLIDEGNTIPFIARYRKEKTGALNDEVLRSLEERLKYLRNLEERKASVLSSIDEQGKLTEELKKQIEAADTLVAVEDLYRPYKQKKEPEQPLPEKRDLNLLPISFCFR